MVLMSVINVVGLLTQEITFGEFVMFGNSGTNVFPGFNPAV